MKKILFFVLLCSSSLTQAQTYSFSHFFGGYTDLTNPVSLNNGVIWDDPNYIVPIGFDFELYGNTITQIEITDEGYGGLLYQGPCVSGEIHGWIAPYLADIIDRGDYTGTSLSPISYQLEGTAGSRILKIEWKNVGFYDGLVDVNDLYIDYLNFQLWLYEGTNVIEMHYGPKSITEPLIDFEDETGSGVGLFQYDCDLDEIAGNSYFISGNPLTPTVFNPVTDTIVFLDGIIPVNMTYRFLPAAAETKEIAQTIDFTVSPNPATDILTVNINDLTEVETVTITDLTGKHVFHSRFQSEIDLSQYPVGYYILEVQAKNGAVARTKFLKQ